MTEGQFLPKPHHPKGINTKYRHFLPLPLLSSKNPREGRNLGGYSWEFMLGVCRLVFLNPDPISDQKVSFPHPFSDLTSKNPYPFSDLAFSRKLCHNRNALTAALNLACLEIRSRNEEAINSTRNRNNTLKVFYFLLYRR